MCPANQRRMKKPVPVTDGARNPRRAQPSSVWRQSMLVQAFIRALSGTVGTVETVDTVDRSMREAYA